MAHHRKHLPSNAGVTLLELIIATAILVTLASAAMPMARVVIVRGREMELRHDLRDMRDAIDRYKDAADKGQIRVDREPDGYPHDLDTLVKGVQLTASAGDKRVRFFAQDHQ